MTPQRICFALAALLLVYIIGPDTKPPRITPGP